LIRVPAVVVSLESNKVGEASHRPTFVFPSRRRNPRNPVISRNSSLIDDYLGEVTRVLVPLQGMGNDGVDVHFTAEVAPEIAEMGALFDNGAGTGEAVGTDVNNDIV
jgi:hypothetical protein